MIPKQQTPTKLVKSSSAPVRRYRLVENQPRNIAHDQAYRDYIDEQSFDAFTDVPLVDTCTACGGTGTTAVTA